MPNASSPKDRIISCMPPLRFCPNRPNPRFHLLCKHRSLRIELKNLNVNWIIFQVFLLSMIFLHFYALEVNFACWIIHVYWLVIIQCFLLETEVLPERLNYLNTPQFDAPPSKKKSVKSNSVCVMSNWEVNALSELWRSSLFFSRFLFKSQKWKIVEIWMVKIMANQNHL